MTKPQTVEFNKEMFVKRLMEVSGCETQKELADRIGCDVSTISKWNNPERNDKPQISLIMQAANVLGCSVDYLLGIDDVSSKGLTVRDICKTLIEMDKTFCVNLVYSNSSNPPTLAVTFPRAIKNPNSAHDNAIDVILDFAMNYNELKKARSFINDDAVFFKIVNDRINALKTANEANGNIETELFINGKSNYIEPQPFE